MAYRVTQRIISSDDLYIHILTICAESPSCCTMQLFFVCGISLPVMTKNIGQRTKSKSFKKLRYYNDLIQTCTSAE